MKEDKVIMLLDTDIIIYQTCTKHETEIRWDRNEHTLHSSSNECIPSFIDYVKYLQNRLQADEVICALSDKINFRKSLFPDYKANRKTSRKPMAFKETREYVEKNYKCVIKPTLEADDVLGILSTSTLKKLAGKKIIVSIDKDFESIPGYLFNPDKDESPRYIDLNTANFRFYKQVLTGDNVDNYPGCYGVGSKTADKILGKLTDEAEIWKAIVKAYEKEGFNEEFAITQARMARILRHEDYDFKNSKIKLWQPKKA